MSESTINVRHHDAQWEVVADWREDLLGSAAPDWFALEQDARATCFKKGYRRSVWRVAWNGKVVFAKITDASEDSIRNRLKGWLIGSQAQREWRACRKAASRGVSVIHALAVGIRSGTRARTVFLSEALPEAVGVVDLWEQNEPPRPPRSRHGARVDLITCIARFFAEAHQRGFAHQDGHPGNVLVTPADDGTWRGVFVDVHPVRFTGGPVSYRATLRGLAQFDDHFQRHATRAERLRFLRCYWSKRYSFKQTTVAERTRLSDLARVKAAHAARLARHRDRRLRRDGKYFATLRLEGGWRATVVCVLERRHLFPEPCIPDRTTADWRAVLSELTAHRSVDAPRIYPGLVVERKSMGGLAQRLAATVGRSGHQALFEACHRDRHRDRAT
ncbi:MAG: hypothetical protein IH989_07295, partial [Planctomycetes bacterium]|nr:hypothetical protein [Planctomycetota bacterium]